MRQKRGAEDMLLQNICVIENLTAVKSDRSFAVMYKNI